MTSYTPTGSSRGIIKLLAGRPVKIVSIASVIRGPWGVLHGYVVRTMRCRLASMSAARTTTPTPLTSVRFYSHGTGRATDRLESHTKRSKTTGQAARL
jgi:hypothetical protein